ERQEPALLMRMQKRTIQRLVQLIQCLRLATSASFIATQLDMLRISQILMEQPPQPRLKLLVRLKIAGFSADAEQLLPVSCHRLFRQITFGPAHRITREVVLLATTVPS